MFDSFSVLFKIVSSFYQIYLKIIWITFCAPCGIYVTCVFSYTVDTGGGDGAANFTQLDSDYSEPGKHVWTLDMMSVCCMFAFKSFMACLWTFLWKLYFMHKSGKLVSESHMLLDTYLHSHVMAWGWVRWQCCGMPVLCQSIWLQCHRESNHIPIHFHSWNAISASPQ